MAERFMERFVRRGNEFRASRRVAVGSLQRVPVRGGVAHDFVQVDTLGLALQHRLVEEAHDEAAAVAPEQVPRPAPAHHPRAVVPRQPLDPRRLVDRVPEHREVQLRRRPHVAHQHRPALHPRLCLEHQRRVRAVPLHAPHRGRHSAQPVLRHRLHRVPHGHDRVAQVLVHDAARALDHPRAPLVERRHLAQQRRLRQPLRVRREVDDVNEHDARRRGPHLQVKPVHVSGRGGRTADGVIDWRQGIGVDVALPPRSESLLVRSGSGSRSVAFASAVRTKRSLKVQRLFRERRLSADASGSRGCRTLLILREECGFGDEVGLLSIVEHAGDDGGRDVQLELGHRRLDHPLVPQRRVRERQHRHQQRPAHHVRRELEHALLAPRLAVRRARRVREVAEPVDGRVVHAAHRDAHHARRRQREAPRQRQHKREVQRGDRGGERDEHGRGDGARYCFDARHAVEAHRGLPGVVHRAHARRDERPAQHNRHVRRVLQRADVRLHADVECASGIVAHHSVRSHAPMYDRHSRSGAREGEEGAEHGHHGLEPHRDAHVQRLHADEVHAPDARDGEREGAQHDHGGVQPQLQQRHGAVARGDGDEVRHGDEPAVPLERELDLGRRGG
mmetsp:Transcript_22933/g.71122  ORF Transcript_22933/g.71122 Transcript_22933/m.71122 type:complete len:618 (+) Transcript_22933:456-2309(+)